MKCDLQKRDEWIHNYISGLLSDEDRALFEEHCFNCEVCFQELIQRDEKITFTEKEWNDLYADYIKKLNEYKKQKKKSPGFLNSLIIILSKLKVQVRYRFVYASLVAGAVMFLLFFLSKSIVDKKRILNEKNIVVQLDTTRLSPQITAKQDSFEIKKLDEEITIDLQQAYAANFTPYVEYEYEIGTINRSFDYSLQVVSPQIGENILEGPHFQWLTDYNGTVYLEIFSNKDSLLFSTLIANKQLHFTKNLVPGLYYWKLKSENDLLYLGKFFVNKPKN